MTGISEELKQAWIKAWVAYGFGDYEAASRRFEAWLKRFKAESKQLSACWSARTMANCRQLMEEIHRHIRADGPRYGRPVDEQQRMNSAFWAGRHIMVLLSRQERTMEGTVPIAKAASSAAAAPRRAVEPASRQVASRPVAAAKPASPPSKATPPPPGKAAPAPAASKAAPAPQKTPAPEPAPAEVSAVKPASPPAPSEPALVLDEAELTPLSESEAVGHETELEVQDTEVAGPAEDLEGEELSLDDVDLSDLEDADLDLSDVELGDLELDDEALEGLDNLELEDLEGLDLEGLDLEDIEGLE